MAPSYVQRGRLSGYGRSRGRYSRRRSRHHAADTDRTSDAGAADLYAKPDRVGHLRGVFAAARDITAQKQLEEQIRQQNRELTEATAFLNNVLESSTEYSIIAKDLDGNILAWNEGAKRNYGYKAKKYQGTGLGLALTKRIVEAQRGEVGVRSTPGRGSIFWARLARKFKPVENLQELEVEPLPATEGRTTVLVIEDESKDRAWLIKVLSDAGYAPTAAATGAEAVHHLRTTRFDIITLDILLPDVTAAQLMGAIRESELNGKTPVIACSITDRGSSMAFAVRDWLVKPVRRERLLKALKDASPQCDPNDSCVLVIDDDPSSLKLAGNALKGQGYRTLCVSEGEEGLK